MKEKQIKISLKMVIIIICIIVILIIGTMVIIKLNVKKDKDEIYNSQITNFSELEKLKDSELSELFYSISKGDEFVNETIKDYRFTYKGADSEEDAIEKTKTIGQDSNTKILELKLQDETDYYYVIYQEYISYRGTGDVTFKNSYLYFKNSILDINNKTINTNILNDANKVKEIFNIYTYIINRDNGSIKLLLPKVTENSNEYIYSYYYFTTSYGDWGLSDSIKLYKSTTSINKQSGKYESNDKMIRQVSGKYNEYTY